MKYICFLLIPIFLFGCKIDRYAVLTSGERINCSKVGKICWGERGVQPTSKEARDLCACYPWVLETK